MWLIVGLDYALVDECSAAVFDVHRRALRVFEELVLDLNPPRFALVNFHSGNELLRGHFENIS